MNSTVENKNILIINGSLGGESGNTSRGLKLIEMYLLKNEFKVNSVNLRDLFSMNLDEAELCQRIFSLFSDSQGVVFATGTYWDSWGSPMQRLFELMTPLENKNEVLGKPMMTFVTMHSVGGKEVLSRMQGVLNTFGFYQPPLCGLVYSMVNDLVAKSNINNSFKDDLWSIDDLSIICDNFISAVKHRIDYKAWPVDRQDPYRIWWT